MSGAHRRRHRLRASPLPGLRVRDIELFYVEAGTGDPLILDDTVGLMDALGIERAHVCGASMGGMCSHVIARRVPAELKTIANAGHAYMREQPDAFNAMSLEFLARRG